jgi:hypothetical protein
MSRKRSATRAQQLAASLCEEDIAAEMANTKGEYTMTWTTEPSDGKDNGAPQKGYPHGNITPQEARALLGQFDPKKGDPATVTSARGRIPQ